MTAEPPWAQLAGSSVDDLRVRLLRFEAALENMSHGVCFFDGSHRLILGNRRFAEMYGIPAERMPPGTTLREVIALRIEAGSGPRTSPEDYHAWRLQVARREAANETVVETANGRFICIKHQPMPDGGWVATHEDITEQRRAASQIAHMAHHDPLTGLANRVLFRDRLDAAFGSAPAPGFALLCIDLDRFKEVNDAFGHPVGDALLQAVSGRLRSATRDDDTLARLGGDEFALIQGRVGAARDASRLAQRIVKALSSPFDLAGHRVGVGASVGVAIAPTDGDDPEALLKNADTALYRAKAEGRGCFRFFQGRLKTRTQARQTLEHDLRRALAAEALSVSYQPWLDVATRRVAGVEALLRWVHPQHGPILPQHFIPLAEETGLILPIGDWVLGRACADAIGMPNGIRVAVNLSPLQLAGTGCVARVEAALRQSGLDPARLELELTETVMLHDTAATLATLQALRQLGVGIALDDFGTGYSSLSALQRFPFTKVKIDQSFVRTPGTGRESGAIVRAVAELCRVLGMATTAEGIETVEQFAAIATGGCTDAQGFLFSPAVPAGELPALLARLDGGAWHRTVTDLSTARAARRSGTVRRSAARPVPSGSRTARPMRPG